MSSHDQTSRTTAQPAGGPWPEITTEQAADYLPPSDLPPSAVPPELLALKQYAEVRLLGRGGMGAVYLAKNALMDRFEVLKVIGRELLGRPEVAERFLREMRSAAQLSHTNVVTAYTAMLAGDLLVFAMEYVPGQNLSEVVKANGPLAAQPACYYVYQAAQGLQHAHEKGMVHRDIKPGNLILHKDGKKRTVKVLDFGLAKATSEKDTVGLTATGQVLGTPEYMAPEQTEDAGHADIRADVYALGCTLFYMLAGQPPFQTKSLFELMLSHREVTPPRLDAFRSDVPPGLQEVLDRLLAKNPDDRFQTPVEVARALLPIIKGVSSEVKLLPIALDAEAVPYPFEATLVREQTVSDEPRPRRKKRPKKPVMPKWLVASVGLTIAVVTAVAVWLGLMFGGSTTGGQPTPERVQTMGTEGRKSFIGISGGRPVSSAKSNTDDKRHFWRFARQHGSGYFKRIAEGRWEEIGRNGERVAYWTELARTDEYVELEDVKRSYLTRLGAGKAWLANRVDRKFNPSPHGDWER